MASQPAFFQAVVVESMLAWTFKAVAASTAAFKATQSALAGGAGGLVQEQPAPRAATSVSIVGSVGLILNLASSLAVAALQSNVQLPVAAAEVLQASVLSQAESVQATH